MRAQSVRGAIGALRRGFAVPAKPPWSFGLTCATAIATPLLVAALAGDPRVGGVIALGACLAAFGDKYGQPYVIRAKNMVAKVALITFAYWFGMMLGPHPWLVVLCTGLISGLAAWWPAIGPLPVMATVIGFYHHSLPPYPIPPALLLGAGGVIFGALALSLWPVRRLNPLRDALRAADDAMAGMLNGLDLPVEEWVKARKQGSKKLEAAATAAAPYHRDDGEHAPDRYVSALTRIFHESVALRVFRAHALATGPSMPLLDEAVAALSHALREQSDAAVRQAIAAVGVFAEYASGVRMRDQSNPDAMRHAALLGQIRRCLDRIAVAVRTGGAVQRVQAAPALPKISWHVPSGTIAPGHAVRRGLTVALALALMLLIHEPYGMWFVFTVQLGLRATYGDTIDRVVWRVSGAMFGTALAAVILAAVPGTYTVVLTVWLFAAVGLALREVSFAYWQLFSSPLMLILADFTAHLGWGTAGTRLLLTAGGGTMALVAAKLIWPQGEKGKLTEKVVDLLWAHANMVRTLAEQSLDKLPEQADHAGQTADELSAALDRLEKEPGGIVPEELREALADARKVRDDVILLSAVVRGSDVGWDATAAVLDAVADRLEMVAEAVRQGKQVPEGDELDQALDAMATRVDALIGEVAAGEEDTSIRRELRHAVAAHPALLSLCSDALRLARRVS